MEEWKNNDSKDFAIKKNKIQNQNISENNIFVIIRFIN